MSDPVFVNPEVPIDSLPSVEQLRWEPLAPRFARCLQAKALVVWTVVLASAAVANFLWVAFADAQVPAEMFQAIWALLAAWALRDLFWPLVDVPRRGYAVRERDIVFKTGVIWQSVKVVPYCRVQHAETNSGPVDRRFGLAKLVVYTAGGSGGDLRIDGLEAATAQRLRVHVADRIGGPEEPDEQPDGGD